MGAQVGKDQLILVFELWGDFVPEMMIDRKWVQQNDGSALAANVVEDFSAVSFDFHLK